MAAPLIVQAFFDDTGAHRADEGTFVWAGYLAPVQIWAKFHAKWCQVLNREPRIDYWHTTTAHHGGYGSSLDREAREEKELRLAKVIGSFREHMVGLDVRLSLAEHAEHVRGKLEASPEELTLAPGLYPVLETPHFLALRAVIASVVGIAREWSGQVGRDFGFSWIIFEDAGQEWQDHACFSVQALRKLLSPEDRKLLGPVVFLPGKGRGGGTPLEAADLFAWHLNRQITRPEERTPKTWEFLSQVPLRSVEVSTETMKSLVQDLNGGKGLPL